MSPKSQFGSIYQVINACYKTENISCQLYNLHTPREMCLVYYQHVLLLEPGYIAVNQVRTIKSIRDFKSMTAMKARYIHTP